MGLLSDGTPIEFSDEYSGERTHVKMHGVDQFVHLWRRLKGRRKDSLLWGDEVEMVVFGVAGDSKDYRTRTAKLRIDLTPLSRLEHAGLEKTLDMAWKPEYAAFMLEGTPGAPYGPTLADLLSVYPNMRWRRRIANHACALKNASGDVLGGVTEGVPGGALGSRGPKDLLGSGVVTLTSPMQLGTPDSLIRFSGGPVTPGPLTPEPVDPLALSHTLGPVANSVFIPDVVIHPHPRFATLTKNIRARRGSNVDIRLPLFVDSATPVGTACYGSTPSVNASLKDTSAKGTTKGTTPADTPNQSKKEQVHLDAMAFGMGCACLQITFQACSINEARRLYDQLAVVSPLLLSLSAASPVFRGLLTDIDCRWDVISGSVDDRTPSERGLEPLDGSPGKQWRIHKSRYGSISSYLSPGPGPDPCASPAPAPTPGIAPAPAPVNGAFINGRGDVPSHWREEYNDIELEIDVDVYAKLCAEGVDHHLARHVAHLFIRDPLVIYRELLHQEDTTSSDHFENIQSTNWQTMRFKPPPPSSPTTGWRVEFRSLEIQLSDYENAAFAVFVVLLTRTILSLRTNFYMPISLVDSNLASAQKRNAALAETFWWRRDVLGVYPFFSPIFPVFFCNSFLCAYLALFLWLLVCLVELPFSLRLRNLSGSMHGGTGHFTARGRQIMSRLKPMSISH